MKILFCGGGTAGHVYPAIAMAEIIKERYRKSEFLFVGRAGGDENRAITEAGYRLKTIEISGFKRKLSFENIKRLRLALTSLGEAKKIIHEFSPDLIIGTGGYVSWPILVEGRRAKIPTMIHEANAVPGLVTKMLSRKVDMVMLGFERAGDFLPKHANTRVVGNPVRQDFKKINRATARRKLGIGEEQFMILSFGGSLGAEVLNRAITECMRDYGEYDDRIVHIHATGKRYYDSVTKTSGNRGKKGQHILAYIDNMPLYLSSADIAITRSGAITTAEIIESEIPSILIPSPNVSGNHQYENAKVLSDKVAAILLPEIEADAERIREEVLHLYENRDKREKIITALRDLKAEKCEDRILNAIREVLRDR